MTASLTIRVPDDQRDLIDRAAEATHKTRTDFMLESACKAAEDVLLDRRLFFLDETDFAAFSKALDAPPERNVRLRALLAAPAPWGR